MKESTVDGNDMRDFLVVFIFGFGLVSFSLLLSVLGILKDKYWFVIIGASGANGFVVLPLLFQMLSAAAIHEKNRLWAWIFLAPSFFVVLWIIGVALFYNFS